MKSEVALYIGTSTMVFLALMFIIFVIWASSVINKFKEYSQSRDKHYMERINSIESLIRTEFKQVISSIKNI